jgi:hypothetical protein
MRTINWGKMTVAGDSRERALELARRMEESRRFAQTQVTTERYQQSNTGDNEQVEIVALYIPEPLVAETEPKTAPKTETKPKTATKPKTDLKAKPVMPKGSKR